jgi:hypothetical protein
MRFCRMIVWVASAACGTTSVVQHRSASLGYQEAARTARSRGDATEATHLDALAAKEAHEAQAAAELSRSDYATP